MTGHHFAILLGPDKNPAKGKTLLTVEGDPHPIPKEIQDLWRAGEVAIGWSGNQEIRRLPEASLAKLRRTRLHNKLNRDLPLLADQLEERELASRPQFFAGKRLGEPSP